MGLLNGILEVMKIVLACAWLALIIFGASLAFNFGILNGILEVMKIVLACAWLALIIFGASVAWNFGKWFTNIMVARWRVSEMDKMMKEHPEMFEDAPKKKQRRK